MPETTETTEVQPQVTEPQEPSAQLQQPATSAVPTSWEDVFKHPRFKELNERARKAEETLKQQQEAALKEQNKYKELYEQREAELKTERTRNMKLRIVNRFGVTGEDAEDLADRLKGETEEELTKDAEKFVSRFAKSDEQNTPPGVPPHKSGGSATLLDVTKETDPAKIREALRKGQIK